MARPARKKPAPKKPATKKAPAKKTTARRQRQQAADKTAMRAIQDIGIERAFAATQGELSASLCGIGVHMHKVVGRYFDSLPELTGKDALFAHRIAIQAAQAVATLNDAPPPFADGSPLPQPGDGAKIIDAEARPAMPPGMIEFIAERDKAVKGQRGDG